MSKHPEYSSTEVGKRIALLRQSHGLGQTEFARIIGVQQGEVGAWESGGRRPSAAKAKGMIAVYGITLDWLFLDDWSKLPHDLATRMLAHSREGSPQGRD